MNILVLNGSPKKEKSNTIKITNAFLNGISEVSNNNVKRINTIDYNINHCKGCLSCMRTGKCIINDDMTDILEDFIWADMIIWSFPLYGYSMPSNLKALVDRTLPLSSVSMKKVGDRYVHVTKKDFSKLKSVMICGCGFPNFENNFIPMRMIFKNMFGNENTTIITVAEAPMFNAIEAQTVTIPFLDVITKAGEEYIKEGKISDDTYQKINTPMIPADVYIKIVNGNV